MNELGFPAGQVEQMASCLFFKMRFRLPARRGRLRNLPLASGEQHAIPDSFATTSEDGTSETIDVPNGRARLSELLNIVVLS